MILNVTMIHYHGTPIGGTKIDAARFLQGRHALVPFAYQQDLGVAFEVCQSVMFDNSAFTKWKSGAQGTPEQIKSWSGEFIEWCEEWHRHPSFDGALIPDVIDGDEEVNDELIAEWPASITGIPVWHLHESLDRLVRLAQTFRTVALGSSGQWSSPGTKGWWARMDEAMSAICDKDGKPTCRLHGLRMLNPEIFRYLPLASADSTNAGQNNGSLSRFGMYAPPSASQRAEVIAERIEAYNSAPVWIGSPQDELFILGAA